MRLPQPRKTPGSPPRLLLLPNSRPLQYLAHPVHLVRLDKAPPKSPCPSRVSLQPSRRTGAEAKGLPPGMTLVRTSPSDDARHNPGTSVTPQLR